jgi:hypothetical protein
LKKNNLHILLKFNVSIIYDVIKFWVKLDYDIFTILRIKCKKGVSNAK